jgi:hypothetical protein
MGLDQQNRASGTIPDSPAGVDVKVFAYLQTSAAAATLLDLNPMAHI